jgi:hypothetical protein
MDLPPHHITGCLPATARRFAGEKALGEKRHEALVGRFKKETLTH